MSADSILTPDKIQELVTKAFVIEAITDKPGCTTRYEDLPGKPLESFIMAGINSAKFFSKFALEYTEDDTTPIYKYAVDALRSSNTHKSDKFVNFGLIEIMFPVVAARLKSDSPDSITKTLVAILKATTSNDVKSQIDLRKLAWSTSTNSHKVDTFDLKLYVGADSVWDFYMRLYKHYPADSSNYQWAEQFKRDLPILNDFFTAYMKSGNIMTATKPVFLRIKDTYPHMRLGIIADMCAAAIFLWLSFNDDSVV